MFGKNNDSSRESDQMNGFIGKHLTVTGKLNFEGTVRIDGRFTGEIDSTGTLIVGDEGVVEAKIKVDATTITGEVKGEIDAASRIELRKPCKMYGNLKTPNLIIGEGVVFEGSCEMGELQEAVVTPLPIEREG
ncbi:MAG: polymer-forming cytoskeletal protein [Thermodesulfobacteriota bacterium]